MAYIGRQLVRGQNRVLDDISGSFNGSTTAFNLTVSSSSSPPASVNQLWIILGGVLQKPGTDFTVADAVITFTTAPASTLSFWGMIQGDTSDINSPADASVTPSKIANSGDFAFPADVRFKDADGSHYVGLQAPSTVSSNLVWTLPAADGSANYLLKTDGSGNLGWAADSTTDSTKMPLAGGTFTGDVTFTGDSSNGLWDKSANAFVANLTGTASIATSITVADESTDTSCNVLFATAATGNLGAKSGTNLTFNSNTGALTATSFVGALTGTASGNAVLTGSTDNTICTVTGANAIQGEANLTYDGTYLNYTANVNQTYSSATDTNYMTSMANSNGIKFLFRGDGLYIGDNMNTSNQASGPNLSKIRLKKNGDIELDGNVIMSTAGQGIDFSVNSHGAGMTSELLDSYEEGTWTPHDDSGEGLTLAVVEAVYTRIGRLVIARAEKVTYPTTSNNSGARIGGLPFTVGAAHGSGAAPVSSNAYAQRTLANDGSNYIWVYAHETDGGSTNANLSGAVIYGICIIYEAA